MHDCLFCELVATKNGRIFYENDSFVALWDIHPLTPGHAFILPKRHVQYVGQLTDAEASELMPLARQVSEQIRGTDLEELYTQLLHEESTEMIQEYYNNALRKAREYNRQPEAFNFGINDGPEAGQSVPHLHLHIIPRWAGDVENPRGGVRNMFSSDKYSTEPK